METQNIYYRYRKLTQALEEISGLEIEKNTNSRKNPYPLLRFMIYSQLRKDGYSLQEISKVCHKNHATILSGIETLSGIIDYPNSRYTYIAETYDKFIDSVNDNITIKLYPSQWNALQKLAKIICVKEIQ